MAKATLKDLKFVKKMGLEFKYRSELGGDFTSVPISVQEVVFEETKNLLLEAIKLKEGKLIHTTWTYQDRAYIRKDQAAKPLLIRSEEDLRALRGN